MTLSTFKLSKLLEVSTLTLKGSLLVFIFMTVAGLSRISAQATYDVPTGSFIINMGITPQTVNNALRPYGMIYDLIKNYNVTVVWSINPNKDKDGTDFTFNGVDYRGGTFIIPAQYRTTTVNARITHWVGQGVVGVTTNAPVTVPLYRELKGAAPRWTLDQANGSIAVPYFTNAAIPATAYGGSSSSGWKVPANLGVCDDIFV